MKIMRATQLAAGLLVVWLIASPCEATAQEPRQRDGTVERIGRSIDEILGDIQREFKGLSSEVQRRFAQARSQVESLSVEARVYSRIHWDKDLTEADIAVEVTDDAKAVLSGEVADEAARRKAGALAGSTVGVSQVINNLRIAGEDPGQDEPSPES